MNSEVSTPISKEEIQWVQSKCDGIQKLGRRMLEEAIEIGEWFIDAEDRMGIKRAKGVSGTWTLWLRANFSEIHPDTIRRYIKLAEYKTIIMERITGTRNSRIGIDGAYNIARTYEREQKELDKPLELPPAEFGEPLLILRDELKSYVHQRFQLEYLKAQIQVRIKDAKLGRKQIRQAIEWSTREHTEIRELVLHEFLS